MSNGVGYTANPGAADPGSPSYTGKAAQELCNQQAFLKTY